MFLLGILVGTSVGASVISSHALSDYHAIADLANLRRIHRSRSVLCSRRRSILVVK